MRRTFKYAGFQLHSLPPGTMHLRSANLEYKLFDGTQIKSDEDLSIRYEAAARAFLDSPSRASWDEILTCIRLLWSNSLATPLRGLKLSAIYQNHLDLIQSFEPHLIISTTEAESQARFRQAGAAFQCPAENEIPVTGGIRTEYSACWTHPITSLEHDDDHQQLVEIMTVVLERARATRATDLGKRIATVLQGVLSDLFLTRITGALSGMQVHESYKLYATSGKSNPGYGIIFPDGHAYEAVLNKNQVTNFCSSLCKSINAVPRDSSNLLAAIMPIIIEHLTRASATVEFCHPVPVPAPRIQAEQARLVDVHLLRRSPPVFTDLDREAMLRTFSIPNQVHSIGSGAFGNCSRLTRIDIPRSTSVVVLDDSESEDEGLYDNPVRVRPRPPAAPPAVLPREAEDPDNIDYSDGSCIEVD